MSNYAKFPLAFLKYIWYIADMKQDIVFKAKTKTTYGRGYAYFLRYHLVWCTKNKVNILTTELSHELSVFLRKTASDIGIEILQEEIFPDYVHLLISCRPQTKLSDDIKIMKGNTARWLYQKHPDLKNQVSGIWDTHYLAVIDNEDFQEQIDEYLTTRRSKGGKQPMS